METKINRNGNELEIALIGRLELSSVPEAILTANLEKELKGVTKLILDLKELEYTATAGLRMFLAAQKVMQKQGEMIVRNANESVKKVFEVTGFSNILTIE